MNYRPHPMMSPMIAMRLPGAISIRWLAIVMCQRILADMRMKSKPIPILSIHLILKVYNAFKFGGGGNLYSQPGGGLGPYAGRERERERFEVYKTMAERASEFGRNE